jgi:hypothetical protein
VPIGICPDGRVSPEGPLAQLVAHLHDALAPMVRGFTLPYGDFLVNRPFALASASEQGS